MSIDLKQQTITLELTELALITANGPDAINFLDDQFTNDVVNIEKNSWQFNGYCNAKGRLVAVMRLFKVEDNVFMLIPKSLSEALIKRLQIYVFRAKVQFEIVEKHRIYCLAGPNSNALINIDLGKHEFSAYPNGYIMNLSADIQRFLLLSNGIENFQNLDLIRGEGANDLWRSSEISENIPTVYPETIEKFIPQHINLDLIDGVNFKKGCFPGQEVVARLHYLGKSKQSMQRIEIKSDKHLSPGDSVTDPESAKPLIIVDAIETTSDTFDCLAVGQFNIQ